MAREAAGWQGISDSDCSEKALAGRNRKAPMELTDELRLRCAETSKAPPMFAKSSLTYQATPRLTAPI